MITPVVLCGGAGTRLWPLSRKSFPKQFTALTGADSPFCETLKRLQSPEFTAPLIVTAAGFRFIAAEQAAQAGVTPLAIMLEPEGRSTAPAILAAALHIAAEDPDRLLLIAPADHAIPDAAGFRHNVLVAGDAAKAGRIVTFGIRPTRPETGFGWIEPEEPLAGAPVNIHRFVEKPAPDLARRMFETGSFLWNAGIFLFSARTIIAAFHRHAPQCLPPVEKALAGATADLDFLRLAPDPWRETPDISIDYAIMEHAANLVVMPCDGHWSDLGGWDAIGIEMGTDASGVATRGPVTALDCRDTILRSEVESVEMVGIGLDGIIAVATGDAVLIAARDRAQEVRRAVAALKQKGAPQAESFPRDHRPWGWSETLVLSGRFRVKKITVHPGAALSLQSHIHRSEHWIIVSGTAKVTIGTEVQLVTENQSAYIPLGARHRLENPGKVPMVLIEVQTGPYLGEDDIIRFDDLYARG